MAFARVVSWYKRYERPLSSLSLVGGFVFDALTLKRVDMFWENFWVVIHLLVVASAIFVLNVTARAKGAEEDDLHFWLLNILQFTFGGLLSTFLVFYFRSATLAASWPFLLMLAVAFVLNERLKSHYDRVVFQIGLFFLSIFSFAIFLVPVVVHQIGPLVFVMSGALSLLVITGFLLLLKRFMRDRFDTSRKPLRLVIGGIFLVVNILYFTNIIPPIPLSLKDAGVYHRIEKNTDGDYLLTGEVKTWKDYFKTHDDIYVMPGDALYAYTAIFSPGAFSTTVVHEWQFKNTSGVWVTVSRIRLAVVGGREGGYRTYSTEPVADGSWRVNVRTLQGQLIGRLSFVVHVEQSEPELVESAN